MTAQAPYQIATTPADGKMRSATDYGALRERSLIEADVGAGPRQGYVFRLWSEDPRAGWSATASPESPGWTGDRWFFVDESGVIRASSDGPATAASPETDG